MTVRRLTNAAVGVFTAPIALIAWPFFAAWFMWNESEGFDI